MGSYANIQKLIGGELKPQQPVSAGNTFVTNYFNESAYTKRVNSVESTQSMTLKRLEQVKRMVLDQKGDVKQDVLRAMVQKPDHRISQMFNSLIDSLSQHSSSIKHLDEPKKDLSNVLQLGKQVQQAQAMQAQMKQQHGMRNSR